jgi:predicted MFS family arabinose efflux permease
MDFKKQPIITGFLYGLALGMPIAGFMPTWLTFTATTLAIGIIGLLCGVGYKWHVKT